MTNKKIDPNQLKLNIAIYIALTIGWWSRGVVVAEFGIDAGLWEALKGFGFYVGGVPALSAAAVYVYEKVYRPYRDKK